MFKNDLVTCDLKLYVCISIFTVNTADHSAVISAAVTSAKVNPLYPHLAYFLSLVKICQQCISDEVHSKILSGAFCSLSRSLALHLNLLDPSGCTFISPYDTSFPSWLSLLFSALISLHAAVYTFSPSTLSAC